MPEKGKKKNVTRLSLYTQSSPKVCLYFISSVIKHLYQNAAECSILIGQNVSIHFTQRFVPVHEFDIFIYLAVTTLGCFTLRKNPTSYF